MNPQMYSSKAPRNSVKTLKYYLRGIPVIIRKTLSGQAVGRWAAGSKNQAVRGR